MGLLAWITMGLAIWHFAIFLPDRFFGGIVGSFCFALAGAAIFGLLISGFSIPGNSEVTILTALEGIPGAVIGIALAYLIGVRRGNPPLKL